jgi:MFS family permease
MLQNGKIASMKKFLLIWGGQAISLLGSGLTSFALAVWIFEKTHQATPFALTLVFSMLPYILLVPVAGSLADRWNRKWMMILADSLSALVTLGAAALLWTNRLEIYHVYIMALLGSAFSAFQEPAYSASVVTLVPKEQLGRANGLIQMGQAISGLLAPAIAGFLYFSAGFKWIVLIDFATFFFAVGALLIVRIPQPVISEVTGGKRASVFKDFAFGWSYLRDRPGLMGLLWYFALTNFLLNFAATLLVPAVLELEDARVLGIVQMVYGSGALFGSMVMSAWGGPNRGRIPAVVGSIFLGAASFWVAGSFPSAAAIAAGFFILMFCVPFGSGISAALFQMKVAPEVQGRIFGIRAMISRSAMPLAMLLAGPLADYVFGPWMQAGGLLANTVIGRLLGVGPERGIGLLFILSGSILMLVSIAVYANRHIRNLETDLPDAVTIAAASD